MQAQTNIEASAKLASTASHQMLRQEQSCFWLGGSCVCTLALNDRTACVAETADRPAWHRRCHLQRLLALHVGCLASGVGHSRSPQAQV